MKISGVKEFVIKTVSRGRDVVICVGKVLIFVIKRGAVSACDFYLFLVTGLTGHLATPFESENKRKLIFFNISKKTCSNAKTDNFLSWFYTSKWNILD